MRFCKPAIRFFSALTLTILFSSPPAQTQLLQFLYQKNGADSLDNFGRAIAGAGDVDGDGIADFIVGAPAADSGGLNAVGSVYVYSGLPGALLYQKYGTAAGDNLGYSVASAGDVDGDGNADFIVGAHFSDTGGVANVGSAFVYSGADGDLLYRIDGAAANDFLGFCVAGTGDVNADGNADFIVGAYQADPGGRGDAGSAFVFSGADGSLLFQKDGAASGDLLGISVAGAGDVNADGNDDFIIGAPGADPGGFTGGGSAFVYSGADGTLLFQKDGADFGDQFGRTVASAGDVNADGNADFIIGAFFADSGGIFAAGSASVYSGIDGSLLYRKRGTTNYYFGWSVGSAGDINSDGKSDFIVGAFGANPNGQNLAGSVFIYSGETGALLSRIDGAVSGDQLGYSVAGTGDVNGDAVDDVSAGAPFASPGGLSSAGSVYAYGMGNTPVGSPVVVALPNGPVLIFDSVSAAGNTMFSTSSSGPLPVNGFQVLPAASPLYYDLTTSAAFVDSVTICFLYDPSGFTPAQEAQIKVEHYVANSWVDATTLLDTANNGACGRVGSFSIFALMAPIPTDAPGEKKNRPNQFELSQNYPNPFNPTTTIRYYLPKREKVMLEIFNLVGQRVQVLADEEQTAGEHSIIWDGKDEGGKILPSGVYFYKLTAKDFVETKKMIFLK